MWIHIPTYMHMHTNLGYCYEVFQETAAEILWWTRPGKFGIRRMVNGIRIPESPLIHQVRAEPAGILHNYDIDSILIFSPSVHLNLNSGMWTYERKLIIYLSSTGKLSLITFHCIKLGVFTSTSPEFRNTWHCSSVLFVLNSPVVKFKNNQSEHSTDQNHCSTLAWNCPNSNFAILTIVLIQILNGKPVTQ